MKQINYYFLLATLICLASTQVFAHDIEVANSDGKTIYYNYINNQTELEVSYKGLGVGYYDNEYTGTVVIPESVTYYGKTYPVTSIGEGAFFWCPDLTSINIPNSVTSIGEGAFSGCTGLTSVTIPNSVTSIGGGAFNRCSRLTSVNIPNSVTSIEDNAFADCSDLKSVNIPNSVTSIGHGAFDGCSSLMSVDIPNSVTSIGVYAFCGCSSLTSMIIPNSVTSIGWCAFYGCSGLTSVTIPNSVTSIESGTFQGCSSLMSVTIPNSVTSIESCAFFNTRLKSVTIGAGVLSIAYSAFSFDTGEGSKPIKVIWLTNTPPSDYYNVGGIVNYVANNQYTSLNKKSVYPFLSSLFEVGGIKYVPVSPSERTCDAIDCAYNETAENINISETVSYKGVAMTVKKVMPYTFYGNDFIKSAVLSFKGNIDSYTFAYCSNLQSATLDNEIMSLGEYAFYNCSSLPSINIPDAVRNLGTNVFGGCSSLSKIEIPKSVTSINNYAFSGCRALATVIMKDREDDTALSLGSNGSNPIFADCPLDSVYIGRNISYGTSSSYGYSPFYRNTSLRSVTITDKETEISPNEFYGCTNLKNVRIGNGVTTIGNWAFSGCSSLDYFAFGSAVKDIGQEAFSDCTAMTKLISLAETPPTCKSQALDDINKWTCTLYVPENTESAYRAADQWKEFFFMENTTGIKGVETDIDEAEVVARYDANGRRISSCRPGLNILKMSDGTVRKVFVK